MSKINFFGNNRMCYIICSNVYDILMTLNTHIVIINLNISTGKT